MTDATAARIEFDPLATGGGRRAARARLAIYVVLSLFALYYLLPLGVILLNSFRALAGISQGGLIGLPRSFSLAHWATAWSSFCIAGACNGIAPFFANSLMMVIPATLISTGLGAVNGG